jgi:hypothetical protein
MFGMKEKKLAQLISITILLIFTKYKLKYLEKSLAISHEVYQRLEHFKNPIYQSIGGPVI